MLNNWWEEEEEIPEEVCQARIALILKKGDTANQKNYRPISLLNSIYKIFAAMLKNRIAEQLDKQLQTTQYGFRKGKSTKQAIHLTRRIIDMGERSGVHINMVLLDWGKAFDKVSQNGLMIAMERMGIDKQ